MELASDSPGLPHEGGNFGKVAFFPQHFVWIHGWQLIPRIHPRFLSWFCKENFNSSVKLLRAGGLQVSSFAGCAGEFPDGAYFNTAHLSGRNLRGDLDGL